MTGTEYEPDRDDHGDRPLTDRLRRWGAAVRNSGGAPVDATPDLVAMHRALDAVDAERTLPPLRRWWRAAAALAAILLLAVFLWRPGAGGLPSLPGTAPRLLDVAVSGQRDPPRGQPAPALTAGQPFFVHYFAEGDGAAIAVQIGAAGAATLLTATPVPLGEEPIGPLVLQPQPGLGAVVVVSSATPLDAGASRRVVDALATALRRSPAATAASLSAAVDGVFAGARGLRAVCLPFELP